MSGRIGHRSAQLVRDAEKPDPAQTWRRASARFSHRVAGEALPFAFEQDAPGVHICRYGRRQLREIANAKIAPAVVMSTLCHTLSLDRAKAKRV